MILFGFSLYYALKFTLELEEDQQEDNLMFLYWGTFAYAVLFVIIVQMTYLLVLFESTNKCGIVLVFFLPEIILKTSLFVKQFRLPFPFFSFSVRNFVYHRINTVFCGVDF